MGHHHLPNIILVVCDTLGAKHMSIHGYERRTTPYIERMTEDGGFVVYHRCLSPASWTIPSHVSFFTGLYPKEHRIGDDHVCLPDNMCCLAEILKYLGYSTFGVTSNGLVSGLLNFHKGFDEFYEMWHFFNSRNFFEINQAFGLSKKDVKAELGRFLTLLRLSSSRGDYTFLLKKFLDTFYKKINGINAILKKSARATLRTIDTAKKIINTKNAENPFFLFLNIMETHNQYNPPSNINAFKRISPEARNDALKKYDWHHYARSPFSAETFEILNILYDREVLFLDSVLWDFYSFLKSRAVLDNTLLIITSDHGELLGEHGQFNHVFTLYNELLHVPLLIRYPNDFSLKGERNSLVQLHDIFATIADVAGSPLPVPDSSHSLLSSASREIAYAQLLSCDQQIHKFRQKNPSFIVQDFMQPQTSLITDHMMKIIKHADGHIEIYDLNKDFYEAQELSNDSAYAEQKQKLLQLLDKAH
jgi:arylsulfatase A-like enzyme